MMQIDWQSFLLALSTFFSSGCFAGMTFALENPAVTSGAAVAYLIWCYLTLADKSNKVRAFGDRHRCPDLFEGF